MKKIFGYFQNKEDEGENNDDSEDDDETEEWLDFKDINTFSDGGVQIKAKSLKRTCVQFKEYESRSVFTVYGIFPMTEPWWAAEMNVKKQRGKRYSLVGIPSYTVRVDEHVGTDGIVSILLTKSKVHEDHVQKFLEFVHRSEWKDQLNLENLPDAVAEFGLTSEENKNIMKSIMLSVTSGPGKEIYQCLDHSLFYRYMPQLYPRRFFSMIRSLDKKQICELEEALKTQLWVFGYSVVMASKYKLFGCESSLQNYIDSGLFSELSTVHQDALRIYDELKVQCYGDGHTFVYEEKLLGRTKLKEPPITKWKGAYEFLEKIKIIILENDINMQQRRIYLRKLWAAEESIANGFKQLLENHRISPWEFEIDFESDRFQDFTDDLDQKRAIDLIAHQPLVCLSGKGGCGKTHVVSGVFKYAEELLESEVQRRYQEELFNESDVLDDFTLTQSVTDFERTQLSNKESFFSSSEGICKSENQRQNEEAFSENDDPFEVILKDCDISSKTVDQNMSLDSQHTCKPKGNCNELTSEVVLSQANVTIEGNRFIKDEELEFYSFGERGQQDIDKKDFPTVLLTAPTGKAANLLGKRAHLPSNTLHQVIYNYRRWMKMLKLGKTSCDWKYSKVQALVVDECSLVSVSTFSTMFSMLLEEGCLKKVVLLGDINQLPSIEPGNFLSDVYYSLSGVGLSTLLRTNHRTEAQLIVNNATKISMKQLPVFDSSQNFHQCVVEEAMDGINPDTTMDDISCDQDGIVNKLLVNDALKEAKTSQFVAFRRNDCEAINEICCRHYAKHPTRTARNKQNFQVGDKICSTKNSDVLDHLTEKNIRICNGEIFFIKQDVEVQDGKKPRRYLVLVDDDDIDIKVDYHVLRKNCKIRHAWARTIHTYQGSESETVVYVVGSPVLQTWQHVYTAVTRGKKQVFIISRNSHLQTAVKNEPRRRNTSLRDRLKKIIQRIPKDIFPMTPNKSIMERSIMNSPKHCAYNSPKNYASTSKIMHMPKEILQSNETKAKISLDFDKPVARHNSSVPLQETTNGWDTTLFKNTQSCNTVKVVNNRRENKEHLGNNPNKSQRSDMEDGGKTEKGNKSLELSHNNSQAFSDWGDDIDLSVLRDLVEIQDGNDTVCSTDKEDVTSKENQFCDCDPEEPVCSCNNQLLLSVNKSSNCVKTLEVMLNKEGNSNNCVQYPSVQNRNSSSSSSLFSNEASSYEEISNKGDLLLSPKRLRNEDGFLFESPSKKMVLENQLVSSADISPLRKQFDMSSLKSPTSK